MYRLARNYYRYIIISPLINEFDMFCLKGRKTFTTKYRLVATHNSTSINRCNLLFIPFIKQTFVRIPTRNSAENRSIPSIRHPCANKHLYTIHHQQREQLPTSINTFAVSPRTLKQVVMICAPNNPADRVLSFSTRHGENQFTPRDKQTTARECHMWCAAWHISFVVRGALLRRQRRNSRNMHICVILLDTCLQTARVFRDAFLSAAARMMRGAFLYIFKSWEFYLSRVLKLKGTKSVESRARYARSPSLARFSVMDADIPLYTMHTI